MAFDMYSMYSFAAQNLQGATDDKVICDLERLKHFTTYEEFDEYVRKTFGIIDIDEEKSFKYPNNVEVIIKREKDVIMVGALKDEKQIFGKGWEKAKKE